MSSSPESRGPQVRVEDQDSGVSVALDSGGAVVTWDGMVWQMGLEEFASLFAVFEMAVRFADEAGVGDAD